ncbi:hypothetical protein V5O48_017899 [Marasmius crinis-equi]|uniref:DUF7888 domain-containing protein n=1 Tax=Marasmius crinis-equi TaxID=585013 RepID=A0ABR3EMQ3_9AGAR
MTRMDPRYSSLGALVPQVRTSDNLEVFNATVSLLGHDDDEIESEAGNLAKGAGARRLRDSDAETGAVFGEILADLLKVLFPLKDWTPAREQFTPTTELRWNRNPNPGKYPAVACYSKGWRVKNPSGISAVQSMELSLGALKLDYDCMYVGRNNQDGDGGYRCE